jgi:hypothetical protein
MKLQMEATIRLLLNSGDITMQGARMIGKILEEEFPDE